MFWDRIGLKTDGKEKFRRNYGSCVLVSLIISLITGTGVTTYIDRWMDDHIFALWILIPGAVVLLIQILVFSVLEMGACRFYVENRDYQAGISKILFGFQSGHYGNVVLVMFLRDLFIFLWTLLLIVPGIIKTYEYRMVPYILAEQPDISSTDAFAISKEMMRGQKLEAFGLDLSFIGWWLGSVITCGILGIFWVSPYQAATNAELYAVLRDDWIRRHSGREN
ncbi:MAG TPA: DUF975 family protein [Candidatus Blautia avicola]|uniref:DUF975 family protein n=1 Tax=Candidatus Blautia avicola TaxID=2838483 RepID=A0A9D2TVT6_9FIRM|nr:DUF975 family protein [Candidatus Blautia avicola]